MNLLWSIPVSGMMVFTSMIFTSVMYNSSPETHNNNRNIEEYSVESSREENIHFCKMDKKCKKLAEVVVWEARGEPELGKLMTARVVLNRINHPTRWGDNIHDVVHQRKQFSYLQDMHTQTKPTDDDWGIAYDVAYDSIYRNTMVVTGATHYHTKQVNPSWNKDLTVVAVVGNHIYYE